MTDLSVTGDTFDLRSRNVPAVREINMAWHFIEPLPWDFPACENEFNEFFFLGTFR